ncbi:MAG TPA: hypothetical protein VGT05_02620 [Patescibacteria group bacterium]|nr:hypothetical protein [Patescibacteria group bacterium]
MSIASSYTFQQTAVNLEEYFKDNSQYLPKAPEKDVDEMTKISSQNPAIHSIGENGDNNIYYRTNYSSNYISYNTYALIKKINDELSAWENLETEDALAHISNIKDLLQENADYLTQKSETRILLSMLELLFENNNWETMDKKDIKYFQTELKRFNEGEVNWDGLSMFSKQLYRKKMYLLKGTNNHGKKQKEEN